MTEDEAKTKWCPFARQATLITEDRHGVFYPSGPVANRWKTRGPDTKLTLCIASACMAWRWISEHHLEASGVSPDMAIATDGSVWRSGERMGFCGLAGAPQ